MSSHVKRYKCKVPGCSSKSFPKSSDPSYKSKNFFQFPGDPIIQKKWKQLLGVKDEKDYRYRYICEDHFAPRDFVNAEKKRLNRGVFPKPWSAEDKNQELAAGDKEEKLEADESSDSDDSVSSNELFEPSCAYMSMKASQDFNFEYMSEDEWQNNESDSEYKEFSVKFNKNGDVLTMENVDLSPNLLNFFAFGMARVFEMDVEDERKHKLETVNIHRDTMDKLKQLAALLPKKDEHLQILHHLMSSTKFIVLMGNLEVVLSEIILDLLPKKPKLCDKRWSFEEKMLALSIYKRSELFYRYLYCFFKLPPISTLQVILSKVPYILGLNDGIMQILSKKRKKIVKADSYCSLLFDQIVLENSKLSYKHHDKILGDKSKVTGKKYVTVFLLQGIRTKWCMVLAYYFTSQPFCPEKARNLILLIINQLHNLKFQVCALVMNQTPNNTLIISGLQDAPAISSESLCFKINNKTVRIIYNFPALVRQFRDMFSHHNIELSEGKIAKFEHVDKALELDRQNKFRIAKTLDESLMTPNQLAMGLMDYKTAVIIENAVMRKAIGPEGMHTAELVCMMHYLCNSMSGVNLQSPEGEKYKCLLWDRSQHCKLWGETVKEMLNWKVINVEGDMVDTFSEGKSWQQLFNTILLLWKDLKSVGFKSLAVKNLTLDSLDYMILGLWEPRDDYYD